MYLLLRGKFFFWLFYFIFLLIIGRMVENGVYFILILFCYGIMVRKFFEKFLNDEGKNKSV